MFNFAYPLVAVVVLAPAQPRTPQEVRAILAREVNFKGYDDPKTTLQDILDVLSKQYNLTIQVRRLAGEQAGVPARELSFGRTLGLMKAFGRGMIGGTSEQWKERFERLLKAVGSCRIPRRPNRNYPRVLISRSRGFPQRKREQIVDKKS